MSENNLLARWQEAQRTVTEWADRVMEELNVFQMLANSLPKEPGSDVYRVDFWYDGGDDILCRTEDLAPGTSTRRKMSAKAVWIS